jgi:hypothetical protein
LFSVILTKKANDIKAITKVSKSIYIIVCRFVKDRTAVAIIGVRIPISEFENERSPLTF